MMKILSIRQPYAWLITARHKPVENRSRHTSYRGAVLIHAGQTVEWEAYGDAARLGVSIPSDLPTGGIVGIAWLTRVVRRHPSPWFFGPHGWVLDDAKPLDFVPLKGQLGLFNASRDLLRKLGLENT